MKYSKHEIYGMLKYFADAQPHIYYQQHQLFLIRYGKEVKRKKINIIDMLRCFVQNGWIAGCGEDFYRTYFPFRSFVLTPKGDEYYRILSIERQGDFSTYKYFERDQVKGT